MSPTKAKAIIVLVLIYTALGIYFLRGITEGAETADAPALDRAGEMDFIRLPDITVPSEDLVYIALINGFKVPITIPKGSLSPKHRGKIWQTKEQYDADWERAMKWAEEILEEETNE